MGFLSPAAAIIARAAASAMQPPPPVDITRWCEENLEFDERSPIPGAFDIARFPWMRQIHEALSPEHPCREVTVRGSAQIAKTVSIIQPTLGAWHEAVALDSLVVHPTGAAAREWVDNKWGPMRRQAPSLRATFGIGGGDNNDAKFNQETIDRNGSLKVTSAGSPADLTGTSRRLVILDDVAKFEMTGMGDPEELAESRASGFDEAKVLRVSTPLVKGACRISRAFGRSDQRFYHVPCPHCGHMAPLSWENFLAHIDPENLGAAHFGCEACQKPIRHGDKENILRAGKWVPRNPKGDHPGFHIWRAYSTLRDWASIARQYARVMGWTQLGNVQTKTTEALKAAVEAETEQTFWNDVLGLPFEQATGGADWEALRNRAEAEEAEALPRGIVPACGVLLTMGVDCQLDRTEVHLVAYGRDFRRWTVDYYVIPHHIGERACQEALDDYLKAEWRTALGLRLPVDMMAIDGGTYTEDVWQFAKRYPWSRVIVVKGASSQNGPHMQLMKFERRKDGKARRMQKRGFMLNVSQMKADFYAWLEKTDPAERGYVRFARGLGDEYYRQVTAEVRVLVRSKSGVTTSKWDLVEPSRRNEGLDTMLYSEAAARRLGWATNTDHHWAALEAQRGIAPPEAQADLFDDVSVIDVPDHAKPERGTPAAKAGSTHRVQSKMDALSEALKPKHG